MSDAWIIGEDEAAVSRACRAVAELGFTPLRTEVNGSVSAEHAGAPGRGSPDLAVVLGCAEKVAQLRESAELHAVPVVLTLAADQLEALEALQEADELLVEPYTPAEFRARVARARKSVNGVSSDEVVRVGEDLEIDLATYQVTIAGEPIDFTYTEYELLRFLATRPRRVFTREALLTSVWGYDYFGGERTVDVHVRRVRAKLGPRHEHRLKTVRSVGYRFEA